jgi:hypothetical protein
MVRPMLPRSKSREAVDALRQPIGLNKLSQASAFNGKCKVINKALYSVGAVGLQGVRGTPEQKMRSLLNCVQMCRHSFKRPL